MEVAPLVVAQIYEVLRTLPDRQFVAMAQQRLLLIRRNLADPTPMRELKTRLERWLTDYDGYIDEKQQNETDDQYSERREKVRIFLIKEWAILRVATIRALQQLESLGKELEKISPAMMSTPEWRRYKELL
jgi:hypothetical protein